MTSWIGGKFKSAKSFVERMERKVLLVYGERKQVAVLQPTDSKSTLDLSTIREIAKTTFDVLTDDDTSTLNIQGFDDNFGEWVDLRATFIMEHKQRLRICLKKPAGVSYLC